MYMGLNKKFMLVFFLFFMMIIGLFLGFFSIYYDKNIKAEAQGFLDTSSRLVEIANDNSYLVRYLRFAVEEHKIEADEYLHNVMDYTDNAQNRKIVESLKDIYNKKYDRLQYLLSFLLIGLVWISAGIIILWFLMQYMVLRSVNKLIKVSEDVANGNFSQRVMLNHQIIRDEFSILGRTFNQMLQSIEENIVTIKNNQYFLQSIIDAIPDGLRVMDNEGRIILANRAYINLLGVKKCVGEYCYKQSMNISRMCSENKVKCPLKEFQKNDLNIFSTVQYFSKDQNHPISVNAAKMTINTGKSKKEYIIEAMRDLSREVQFSHQQKISSLAFLATSIAHEMKNNLGSLRIIMEQLSENKTFVGEKEEKYFQLAYNQLLECIKIPENLLNLAKNSSDKTENINLKKVVCDVCVLLDYEAKRKGIDINVSMSDEIFIIGNEPDMKMIFLNLCQNAIKAMPEGGLVEIEAKIKNKVVEVYVKDTGIGIEKTKQKRIFEPFFTGNEGLDTHKGTGLGLSIVKSLVENFSGKIKLQSKKNVGTTFIMTFPFKK